MQNWKSSTSGDRPVSLSINSPKHLHTTDKCWGMDGCWSSQLQYNISATAYDEIFQVCEHKVPVGGASTIHSIINRGLSCQAELLW